MKTEEKLTQVEEMWAALAAYQPQADKNGHGDSWAKMRRQKTSAAAADAAYAAYTAAYYAAAKVDAYAAASAAFYAADAASYAEVAYADYAAEFAQKAINSVNSINSINTVNSVISVNSVIKPPQRTWVGLTDEKIEEIAAKTLFPVPFARAIEAELKKNT